MQVRIVAAAACLLVAGCSANESAPKGGGGEEMRVMDVAEPAPVPPAGAADPAARTAPIPAALPRIAYAYTLGFRLPDANVAALQEAHVAACDKLGPASCQVVDLKRATSEGDYVTASLKLRVAARLARDLSRRLERSVGPAGGTLVDSGIAAEDLSKQMVDTEARIRAKEALIGRLTEILRTKTGNVSQLLEAERAISQAQEELDAAKSWLAEASTRVATSTIDIAYQSASPSRGGFWTPVRAAFDSLAGIFAGSIAALVLVVGGVLPWALLIGLLVWGFRALRRRSRRDKD